MDGLITNDCEAIFRQTMDKKVFKDAVTVTIYELRNLSWNCFNSNPFCTIGLAV